MHSFPLFLAPSVLGLAALAAGSALPQDGLIVDRNRSDRAPPTVAAAPLTQPPTPLSVPSLTPFVAQRIVVQGPGLDRTAMDQASAPFLGQTLDVQGLARLQQAVSQAAARGQAALPFVLFTDGDFKDGVVRLTVIAARIDKVAIYGADGSQIEGDVDLLRYYAARLAAEAPLSRRTAERYFSLIADIPGVTTTLQTVPSATPGALDLGLEIKRERWRHDIGFNTRGSETLGRVQVEAASTLNGLFRMGDQTRFALMLPTDVERFQYVSLSHRTAIGSDGASVTGRLGYLRTRPSGTPVTGDARTAGITVSWPWIRSYQSNLVVSAGLDGLDSANAAFGEEIANERTRVLRASAAWSRVGPRRTLSAGGTVSRGLNGLGARAMPGNDIAFTKANARLDVSQAIGQSWRVSAGATAQATGDRLPVTEQFTLGGADYGRAFTTALVSGDSGWGAKVEGAWRPVRLRGPLAGSEVYAFADTAEARTLSRGAQPTTTVRMSSAGAGARIALRQKTVIGVEAARGLHDPRPDEPERWALRVSATTRF